MTVTLLRLQKRRWSWCGRRGLPKRLADTMIHMLRVWRLYGQRFVHMTHHLRDAFLWVTVLKKTKHVMNKGSRHAFQLFLRWKAIICKITSKKKACPFNGQSQMMGGRAGRGWAFTERQPSVPCPCPADTVLFFAGITAKCVICFLQFRHLQFKTKTWNINK